MNRGSDVCLWWAICMMISYDWEDGIKLRENKGNFLLNHLNETES